MVAFSEVHCKRRREYLGAVASSGEIGCLREGAERDHGPALFAFSSQQTSQVESLTKQRLLRGHPAKCKQRLDTAHARFIEIDKASP